MKLRKSLQDVAFMVQDIPYPRPLPAEIAHLHAYVIDGGHCILAVPTVFDKLAAERGAELYEVPLPVKYVLAKGWKPFEGTDSILVDVPYDEDLGAMVPAGYDEF